MTDREHERRSAHRHGHDAEHHAIYEASEYLDAPPDEVIPEGEVSLARRLTNWRTLLSIAFSIALLALVVRALGANLGTTWGLIVNANLGFLALAFGAYYLTFPLRGYRWRYVLDRVGTRIGFRDATEILYLSWFVNCLVPAKLGDLYRAYLLRGNVGGASASRTVGTIFIERIADLIVIAGLALAAGFWSFRGRSRPELDAIFIFGFVVAAALVVLVVALWRWGGGLTRVLPARFAEFYERFHHGSTGALRPATLPVIGVLTVGIWFLEGMRLYFVVRALDLPDVGLGISAAIFVALIGALLTAVPLTPAGVGFVEFGLVVALGLYGVASDPAFAVALTDRAISILTVIALGSILYLVSRKVRRAHGMARPPAEASPGG